MKSHPDGREHEHLRIRNEKSEQDGKEYYLAEAARTDVPELKKILEQLADDEQKHYNIFKAMKEGKIVKYDEAKQTTILNSVRNVFEVLKGQNKQFAFSPDVKGVWEEAQKVEKKSEDFYREKAGEVTDDAHRTILNRIADEERKHWVTIENVIRFIDRPSTWLENAEWNHIEEYYRNRRCQNVEGPVTSGAFSCWIQL